MAGTYIKRDDGTTVYLEKEDAEQANIDAGAKKVITMEGYIQRISYNASNFAEYIGLAKPGTAISAAGWQIKKLTYSGSFVTEINFAGGDLNFDKVWNNRSGLSYS